MIDKLGRSIDYMRISVTDRCDLRCTYCMPADGVAPLRHSEVLSFEEIVRIVKLASALGVKKVRLTGGEPLVRLGLPTLISQLKAIDGIEWVVLTTNGILLSENLPELVSAGVDGVNISIDAIDEDVFERVTRRSGVSKVLNSIDAALRYPQLKVKLNCVPMLANSSQILPMAERFLSDERLSLRFIELMPIGLGGEETGISEDALRAMLEEKFGEMTPLKHELLCGPCRYYKLEKLKGKVGFISAVSSCFCQSCNRVRLTSSGFLKTCLQFDRGVELRPLLNGTDEAILSAMKQAIWDKPEHHVFTEQGGSSLEQRIMSQIGG
ncbi:MAG: GTP 3',8-cyclase MoaA [Clostridia bacterium]|nr:GTP 3',8-cyclase MoaA [Clostridia bacterium]